MHTNKRARLQAKQLLLQYFVAFIGNVAFLLYYNLPLFFVIEVAFYRI